jgi:hypothetical protein
LGAPLVTVTNLAPNTSHMIDLGGPVTGNGTVTFAVATTRDAATRDFSSREGGNPPVLHLSVASTSP